MKDSLPLEQEKLINLKKHRLELVLSISKEKQIISDQKKQEQEKLKEHNILLKQLKKEKIAHMRS